MIRLIKLKKHPKAIFNEISGEQIVIQDFPFKISILLKMYDFKVKFHKLT